MEKNPQEILDRIQKENLPTVVQAGFMDEKKEGASHAVTFLFWGNRLVVCNRSRDARVPVDMYHFDQTQLTPEILEEINNVRLSGSEEDYKRLIFTTLPKELTLTKTADDQLLEKASVLPYQKVGNCSYVSPITSVYALLLLSTLDLKKTSGHPETMATEALTKYMKWLGFQQIKILERLIEPLQDKKHPIEPDHRLIREALKNAFSLDLDEVVAKKLEDITTSYLSTLIPEEQELLKIECAVWKNLPKNPVLVTKMVSESG
jgi:hypothetical protein